MKGPHICDCLCALCERLGAGAFGPQPDGSAGVVVIRRGRVRRRRPLGRTMKANRQHVSAASLGSLRQKISAAAELPNGLLNGFTSREGRAHSLNKSWGGSR